MHACTRNLACTATAIATLVFLLALLHVALYSGRGRIHTHIYIYIYILRGSSVKLGTIQRRLAWPLRKDDTRKSRRPRPLQYISRGPGCIEDPAGPRACEKNAEKDIDTQRATDVQYYIILNYIYIYIPLSLSLALLLP